MRASAHLLRVAEHEEGVGGGGGRQGVGDAGGTGHRPPVHGLLHVLVDGGQEGGVVQHALRHLGASKQAASRPSIISVRSPLPPSLPGALELDGVDAPGSPAWRCCPGSARTTRCWPGRM